MSEYQRQLISLYASHKVDEIRMNPTLFEQAFGKTTCEMALIWGFPEDQERVETLKRGIEDQQDKFNSTDAKIQIIASLEILAETAMFEKTELIKKMDILKELFLQIFPSWSSKQVEHFNFVFNLLKEWDNYFISYCNVMPLAINDKYKRVIRRNLSDDTIKKNRNEKNLLAEVIFEQLKKIHNMHRGFFDRDNIITGNNVNGTITQSATKTFAFIQLIQPGIFKAGGGQVNWCFDEYKAFIESIRELLNNHQEYSEVFNSSFKAVLTDKDNIPHDFIPASGLPPPYIPWKNHIFTEALYKILPNDPEAFDKTMVDVAYSIKKLQDQIIYCVP